MNPIRLSVVSRPWRFDRPPRLPLVIVSTVLAWMPLAAHAAAVKAYEGQIELPTYPWLPAVRHPYFQGADGRNIYPYPMMDNLSRTAESRVWRTVVLENEYQKATFLPELGGRVYEVFDKIGGRSMFYLNHVVKPGLIGQCGAWISGGIEFNTGPAGHTVSAMLPVDVRIGPEQPDGSRSVAVGELERIYRTHWTVVVTLRPGRSFLEETVRIHNGTETVRPYYFWNCTAMPNTPGFRFVYPMTLGSDHAGDNFFQWPIDKGKDLSLGRNYRDAASIFAYRCDQDFFGSYDEQAEYGVVACANRRQVPGKKAWTWGNGGYGLSHQADLTDSDGPYNEVQTGPLPTQADVGRLDPGEDVAWREYWYPVRNLGGFTFANRDLAVNAEREDGRLRLRLLGTGTWQGCGVEVLKEGRLLAQAPCEIGPTRPADLSLDLAGQAEPLRVRVSAGAKVLAEFRFPLDLPPRTPPAKRPAPRTSSDWVRQGWQEYLFARFPEAEASFGKALSQDARSAAAQTGLAFLNLDRDPMAAARVARAALDADPEAGLAHFALAVAADRLEDSTTALDHAWQAALDPAVAAPARALAAKLQLRAGAPELAWQALAEVGPWQADSEAVNRLALAGLLTGRKAEAVRLASRNLETDPLDIFARGLLRLARAEPEDDTLASFVGRNPRSVLDLAVEFTRLGQERTALAVLDEFALRETEAKLVGQDPIVWYWGAYLNSRQGREAGADACLKKAREMSPDGVFPYRRETLPVLRWALARQSRDGHAALYLGHLLFSLGAHDEGRLFWRRAADLGASRAIAFRALGMASRQLDNNLERALDFLAQAHRADPADAIVARDLAGLWMNRADREATPERKRQAWDSARETLRGALDGGRCRADFVALLARAQNRLGRFEDTARLLDQVRVTIWEGGREVHDLFLEAHLELGEAHAAAGRAGEALTEFDRALEYPANLATGKLESDRQARIQVRRGEVLAALGRNAEAVQAWRAAAAEPPSTDPQEEAARKQAKESLERAGERF